MKLVLDRQNTTESESVKHHLHTYKLLIAFLQLSFFSAFKFGCVNVVVAFSLRSKNRSPDAKAYTLIRELDRPSDKSFPSLINIYNEDAVVVTCLISCYHIGLCLTHRIGL